MSVGGRSSRFYYHKVNLCPECAASRTDDSRILVFVLLGVGGVVLLGCVFGGLIMTFIPRNAAPTHPVHSVQTQKFGKKPEQRPAPISIPPTGVIRISADDLLAQFRADKDAAVRVFSDRTVEVTGKVVFVHKTNSGKPVVTFGEIGFVLSPKVECYFQDNDNPKVLVGQPCTIRGRCMGKSMGVGTWLQECVVLPAPQ
jgi:hypothetical protein